MKDVVVTLKRFKDQSQQTTGIWTARQGEKIFFTCDTLERPWRDNKRGESCYPVGEYQVAWGFMFTNKVYHYEVKDIVGRQACFIHGGNFVTDVHGCTILGSDYSDLNKDGLKDILNSRKMILTFEALMQQDPFRLIIINEQ